MLSGKSEMLAAVERCVKVTQVGVQMCSRTWVWGTWVWPVVPGGVEPGSIVPRGVGPGSVIPRGVERGVAKK